MIGPKNKQFNTELKTLAVPFALQGLLNSLVGASDALMLGRLTQEAIAAVSLANQIAFIMSLFMGAVVGAVGVLVAQYYGKEDYKNVKLFLCMSIRYALIISVIFAAMAFFLPEKLMSIFTNEPELIRIGADYLKIVSLSYIFSAITQCYLMLMKVDGRAKISVVISAVTVIVDMVADFFLIYGFGKIPALGANGSAYSTIAVEAVALGWVLIASLQKEKIRPDVKTMLSFSKTMELDCFKISIPMLASSLSWGLSISAHSAIIGHMGTDITAAYSVTNVATGLIQCLSWGLASGLGIMIGGLLGQNRLDEAKIYGLKSWDVSILCGIANAVLLCIVGPLVYAFYVLEPVAKHYLIIMLLFNILYMFAFSFNTIFTVGVFPAGGDAQYDAISVFIATWCLALPISFLGCFVLNWPPMVVYIVMCLDEVLKFPFLIPRYKKYIWLKNLTREETM